VSCWRCHHQQLLLTVISAQYIRQHCMQKHRPGRRSSMPPLLLPDWNARPDQFARAGTFRSVAMVEGGDLNVYLAARTTTALLPAGVSSFSRTPTAKAPVGVASPSPHEPGTSSSAAVHRQQVEQQRTGCSPAAATAHRQQPCSCSSPVAAAQQRQQIWVCSTPLVFRGCFVADNGLWQHCPPPPQKPPKRRRCPPPPTACAAACR